MGDSYATSLIIIGNRGCEWCVACEDIEQVRFSGG